MKKHTHKIARHSHHRRSSSRIHGLDLGYYDSPSYSPYYAYPLTVITFPEMSSVFVQQNAPLMWAYHLIQDKFSQLTPATEFKISVGSYWILKA